MPDEIHAEEAESLRLPSNWHTLVRCAVLQVIGIVRIAMLTHTRSTDLERCCAGRQNPRTRIRSSDAAGRVAYH